MGPSAIVGMVLMAQAMMCASDVGDELPCVTCSEALSTMEVCLPFLGGLGSDEPIPRCCLAGLRLTEMASTPETRKAVCECFRETKLDPPILLRRVELLRLSCVRNLPIASDPNQDCAT